LMMILILALTPLLVGFSIGSWANPESPVAVSSQSVSPQISPASPSNLPILSQSGLLEATASFTTYLPMLLTTKGPCGGTSTTSILWRDGFATISAAALPPVLESFENAQGSWQVFSDTSGSSSVQQSNSQAAAGSYSARLSTLSSSGRAQIRRDFSDAASAHIWQERPGTYFWQLASVYLPSSTVAQLGPNDYLTLAGLWPSSGGTYGWWLQIRQGGQLFVKGYDSNGISREFRVYGTFPQDKWVNLEVGLHSQNGPGVKRAFAFLVDGDFYGWYHQGHMADETYNRVAMGILSTNSNASLELFIDQWRVATSDKFPGGTDNRSTANLQEQNYCNQSGIGWQIDWSTWGNDLRLDPQHGLYSNSDRLQSGRNIDRMPDLTSGWAEIEIDWSAGPPPADYNLLDGAFAGLVGFRKEINREENLEVAPAVENNTIKLIYNAWVGTGVDFSTWTLPVATTINDGRNIPEPGDIIRVRWEQMTTTNLNVRVSYYDASTNTWYTNVINSTVNVSNISGGGNGPVNYNDGYHTASSITIDSPYYSIRRYKVGTLATYP
jgi:hypothetical protein